MTFKFLPLKNPAWNVNGEDLPSLIDSTGSRNLKKFVQDNLWFDTNDWTIALESGQPRELVQETFINRNFNYDFDNFNIAPLNGESVNYFVGKMDNSNRYFFFKVLNRQRKNDNLWHYNVEMDIWLSYWGDLNISGEAFVLQAHDDRYININNKYVPSFTKGTSNQLNLDSNDVNPELIFYDKFFPSRGWANNLNTETYTNLRKLATKSSVGILDSNLKSVCFTLAFLNTKDKNAAPDPVFDTVNNTVWPFLILVIPSEGEGFVDVSPSIAVALKNNKDDAITEIWKSPYLQNFAVVNVLWETFNGVDFAGNGHVVELDLTGGNNPKPYYVVYPSLTLFDNLYGDKEINSINANFPLIDETFEWANGSRDQNNDYDIKGEPVLILDPFCKVEYSWTGNNTSLTMSTQYLFFEEVVSDIKLKINNSLVISGEAEIISPNTGYYKNISEHSLPHQPLIQNEYAYNNNIDILLPSVSDPYQNYIATSQNTMEAGYKTRAISGIAGALGAGAVGGTAGREEGQSVNWKGGAFGVVAGLIGTAVSELNYNIQVTSQIADLKNSPEKMAQSPTNNVVKYNVGGDILILRSINDNKRQQLYLSRYLNGYVWNKFFSITNTNWASRYWFNFLKISNFNLCFNHDGIPQEVIGFFGNILKAGLRVWHNRTDNPVVFTTKKENLEMSYINATKKTIKQDE